MIDDGPGYGERVTSRCPTGWTDRTFGTVDRRRAGGTAILLALTAVALAGCTSGPTPDTGSAAAAAAAEAGDGLGSWRPPEGAPAFCETLAASEHLDRIPDAIGRLVADPADTRDAWRLTQSTGDLQEVRDAVRGDAGHEQLEAALDDLIDALTVAASGPVEEATGERIAAGLQAVGSYVQPVCEFPS